MSESLKGVLVLTCPAVKDDVRHKVYRHTVNYISQNLHKAKIWNFTDNSSLLSFLKKHTLTTVIATQEIPGETATLLKGLGLVLLVVGHREDLVKVADIVIDPLIAKSEKHLAGLRFLLPSTFEVVSVKEIAALLGLAPDILKEEVSSNQAETEILEISQLYRKLAWDSEFFGMNVGYISCYRLTPNIQRHIAKFLRKEKIDLLQYRCNCHDRESVLVSELNGYSFVDMRLTLERTLNEPLSERLRPGFEVRKALPGDVAELKRVGTDSYKYSRYYFDENFDREKVVELYQSWIEKAVYGRFDDFSYVLCEGPQLIGFCAIKKFGRRSARLNLVGIDSRRIKEGLAKILIDNVLSKLWQEESILHVEVVTQGRNYSAQRLYQRCGFVTKSTELWYHKWKRTGTKVL